MEEGKGISGVHRSVFGSAALRDRLSPVPDTRRRPDMKEVQIPGSGDNFRCVEKRMVERGTAQEERTGC